jgi:ATP-binding cassette subfamily F protein 3
MIRAEGLSLRRGLKQLLDGAGFLVHAQERVGIVGANGAGKSSLFKLMLGQLDAEAGVLDIPAGWRISSIAQEITDPDRGACDFVMDGDRRLRALQAEQAKLRAQPSESIDWGMALGRIEAELEELGAFSARARAEQLLVGLGFAADAFEAPVRSFSGGWQMRLNLARALMAPSDLLLLDEPTNHLDLDAMLWLERWLASYPGTVILISHDTEFLDAVAGVILHLENRQITRYRGGYSDFETQRAEKLRQLQLAHQRQARTVAHLQSFIDRFKAKASKAKQAQSRVKALARMEQLEPLRAARQLDIELPEPLAMPDPLLRLEALSAGYGGGPAVIRNVDLCVRAGERIGILGVNGAGKSTLVKTLAGELPPLAGERAAARGLVVGYFAQHQLDLLDAQASALLNLARVANDATEQMLRDHLGRFGFSGDAVQNPAGVLSGGEKARLALALIVWNRPNLLLLDEPSNHLDIDTREALTEALVGYGGAMLLVSHDRHLLRTTVDHYWIVADGEVREFDGDLDDYRRWVEERRRSPAAEAVSRAAPEFVTELDRRERKRLEAEQRQVLAARRKPLQRELDEVEHQLAPLQKRRAELDALLADPDTYTDPRRGRELTLEHGQLAQAMDALELRWLELQEALEAIKAEPPSS